MYHPTWQDFFIHTKTVILFILASLLLLILFVNKIKIIIEKSLHTHNRILAKIDSLLSEQKKLSRQFTQIGSTQIQTPNQATATSDVATEETVGTKLYVGNVDYQTSEEELAELFSQFGDIELVNIPIHRYTGKTRGFGFVTFIHSDHAEQAIQLNGYEFRGRQIQVSFAKEKDSHSS